MQAFFYRSAKGGVDAAAQWWSRIQSSGLNVRWEQKVLLYFVKTLTANGYNARRFNHCDHLNCSGTSFGSLYIFRELMGRTQPLGDLMSEVTEERLDYAEWLDGCWKYADSLLASPIST